MSGSLKVIKRELPGGRVLECPYVDEYDGKLRTCKRRDCERCGPVWARDWSRVNSLNLEHFGGPVVMVTITAPGSERLPWDLEHEKCKKRGRHVHRGPAGCRVQQRAAREWSDTLTWRWEKLRAAARLATQRQLRGANGELGPPPAILERAYEPQRRGVPHLHVVLGYRTPEQRDAAHVFTGHLKRLSGQYDFGFADGRGKKKGASNYRPVVSAHGVELRPMGGQDAARYLANYLTGRNSKKKNTIRENIADPVMPRSLLWLTPALTSVSASERIQVMRDRLRVASGTGITMRTLRRTRHLWGALEGRCDELPKWRDLTEAVSVVGLYRRIYRRDGPPADPLAVLKFARSIDRRTASWESYERQQELTRFAFLLTRPAAVLPTATVTS